MRLKYGFPKIAKPITPAKMNLEKRNEFFSFEKYVLFIFISSLSVFQCSNFRFKSHFTQVQMFAAVLTPIFELVEVNFRVFILKVDFS